MEMTTAETQLPPWGGGGAASLNAVAVRGAEKSYKIGQAVLQGLNMTVPAGSIYGLLGSSGCGKTTVLSCIVGQRKLDSGDIWIFGKVPGTKGIGVPGRNIGYMPQDISLYLEFSINETLNYFGTLSGLTREQTKSAKSFLVKLLDLPNIKQRVATLSGGQQRRVSFAVALIHQPKLLVLDEPTVGLDPLLRERIWTYLRKLTFTNHTTVIITTHYIEECRQADNIGILRKGRLLMEEQPSKLFSEHGTTNLEAIVLKLSREDTTEAILPSTTPTPTVPNGNKNGNSVYHQQVCCEVAEKMPSLLQETQPSIRDSLVRVRALAEKNIVILLRNPLLLIFVVVMSAVITTVTGMALGTDPHHLPLGVINDEVDYTAVCHNITRVPLECNLENLSCLYLSQIPEGSLTLKIYDTVDDAIAAIHQGNIWGYISFQADFSTNLFERFFLGASIDDVTYNKSQIIVELDETSKFIASRIKKVLRDAFKDFTRILLTDCGLDPRQGRLPLVYGKPVFGKDDTISLEFTTPGMACFVLMFFPSITTCVRFIKEKKSGTLARSLVGGVQTWEVMAAYSISEFFVLLFQSLLAYGVLILLFQLQLQGSHTLFLILFVLCGYVGVSLGFMVGAILSEEIQAAILAMAAIVPNFMLSGLMWPVEGAPVPVQYIASVLSCTLAGESLRSIMSRGWGFTHPNVWPGFAVVVTYILAFFLLTILYHRVIKK